MNRFCRIDKTASLDTVILTHFDQMDFLRQALSSPIFLIVWSILVLLSMIILVRDLARYNSQIVGLMKWVWIFTVLYSGPLGLAIYYYSGRKQISSDSLWRRGFRSTAHCYSGCGAGEVVGVLIAVGLLALGNLWVALITFVLAYTGGFALTVGPLLQEGVALPQALKDAAYTESASIVVMEAVAITVDLFLAQNAGISEILFWSALVFSLSIGFIAAYPVNVLLINRGVKKGMH